MDSGAERQMPVRLALQIEPIGIVVGRRIQVRCNDHGHDPVALLQSDAVELQSLPHIARL